MNHHCGAIAPHDSCLETAIINTGLNLIVKVDSGYNARPVSIFAMFEAVGQLSYEPWLLFSGNHTYTDITSLTSHKCSYETLIDPFLR